MNLNIPSLLLLMALMFSCSGSNMAQGGAAIPTAAMQKLEEEIDLNVLISAIGDDKLVLLGEASHGTSEFYTWRAAITKKLITQSNFNLIAVEGDWADAYPLNKYIRGSTEYSSAEDALQEFDRWPEWMWANEEVAALADWLRNYNEGRPVEEQVGFYGLDVYGIWKSLDAVIQYLEKTNPEAVQLAYRVRECFAPFNRDEQAYARATLNSSTSCETEVTALLKTVRHIVTAEANVGEAAFNALQNTRVVVNAEAYYRAAVRSNTTSWNVRDTHMTGTIHDLLEHYGPGSKIVVWEHNTHVGDARATDMTATGMVNVGQLAREEYGEENVYIVGFGTYKGKVIAAPRWGSRRKVMKVPAARRNSWEWLLHRQGPEDMIVFMNELSKLEYYLQQIPHRAIGVVYNPLQESGNYVPSVLPRRYDAFIFLDKTGALNPLD